MATSHWQYWVHLFRLHRALAELLLEWLMDSSFDSHLPFATAYLNIVVIHSNTWQDHLHHLWDVLHELCQAGLTTNPWKCHLSLTEAQYLGYRISKGLLKPQGKIVGAIKNYSQPNTKKPYPQPNTKKQVHAFLGLMGYYT